MAKTCGHFPVRVLRLKYRAQSSISTRGGDSGISDNTLVPLIALERLFQRQVICVNPDAMAIVAHHEGSDAFIESYKIGYWFWELERLPPLWTLMASSMQEMWVAAEFVRKALVSAVSIPVYTVPPSVTPPGPSRHYARIEFGLHDDDFVFLFTFSYWSFIARKIRGPLSTRFVKRFRPPPSVVRAKLVLKTVNSDRFVEQSDALRALAHTLGAAVAGARVAQNSADRKPN